MQHNLSKDAVRQLIFWKVDNTNPNCYLKQVLEEITHKGIVFIDVHKNLQFTEYGKDLIVYLTANQPKTPINKKESRKYTKKEMIECYDEAYSQGMTRSNQSAEEYLKSLEK